MGHWAYFPFLLAPLRVEPRRGLGLPALGQGLEVGRGAGQRRKATHKVWPAPEDRPGFAIHPQFAFTSPSSRTEITVQVAGPRLAVEGLGKGGDSGLGEDWRPAGTEFTTPTLFRSLFRAREEASGAFPCRDLPAECWEAPGPALDPQESIEEELKFAWCLVHGVNSCWLQDSGTS